MSLAPRFPRITRIRVSFRGYRTLEFIIFISPNDVRVLTRFLGISSQDECKLTNCVLMKPTVKISIYIKNI